MPRGVKPFLLLVACLLPIAAAMAATPPDLYAAATPVADQSDSARNAAFAHDLAAVFVKLTGDPQAVRSGALDSIIAHADKWVIEFRYETLTRQQGGGLALWARFDDKAVDAALARSGLRVWGRERPLVLVWVLTPAGIVNDDSTNPVSAAMKQSAQARGLPLVLPLMDLSDRQRVSDSDIRTLNLPNLQAAANRYDAQALLVGSIRAAKQGVAADWNLIFGTTTTPFAGTAATPQAAAALAVGRATTLLARQLTFVPQSGGGGGKMTVVIADVASLQAQAAVAKLIANAQGVSASRLVGIANGDVRFELTYAGQPADLTRALTLTGDLSQDTAPIVAPAAGSAAAPPSTVLYFRYTP